jgi:hypothetical protein
MIRQNFAPNAPQKNTVDPVAFSTGFCALRIFGFLDERLTLFSSSWNQMRKGTHKGSEGVEGNE